MKQLLLLLLLACGVIASCRNNEPELSVPVENVIFSNYSEITNGGKFDSIFTTPIYIKLNTDSIRGLFSRIDRLKFRRNRFYILDGRLRTLVVYGVDGNFIGKVGKRGNGADEYNVISDFDVDSIGNIIIIDGKSDQIKTYDNEFNFISSKSLPFEADIVTYMKNGDFLFGLSSWDKSRYADKMIAATDKKLDIKNRFIHYDDDYDDMSWLSSYQFTNVGDSIFYNRPINNSIYVLSNEGKPLKRVEFDFGTMNVPLEHRKNIGPNMSHFTKYRLLQSFSFITDSWIIGSLLDKKETKIFALDRKAKVVYLNDNKSSAGMKNLVDYTNGNLISFIHPSEIEKYSNLPSDVTDHLSTFNFVISLQKIHKTSHDEHLGYLK